MELFHENIHITEKLPADVIRHAGTSAPVPRHWHRGVEFIYTISASLIVWINGDEKKIPFNERIFNLHRVDYPKSGCYVLCQILPASGIHRSRTHVYSYAAIHTHRTGMPYLAKKWENATASWAAISS